MDYCALRLPLGPPFFFSSLSVLALLYPLEAFIYSNSEYNILAVTTTVNIKI